MPPAENIPEISVHYVGPAVENGRPDLFVLSDGLRGLGRLTSRVSYLMFGSELDYRIELDSQFQTGSVVIQDAALWERVAKGERFGYGDKMRVELRTTFHRDSRGRLNLERPIPKVIEVEHASQPQPLLWKDDTE